MDDMESLYNACGQMPETFEIEVPLGKCVCRAQGVALLRVR